MIESINNKKVKYWSKLSDKKFQLQEGLFLVEGEHLVEEAYKSGYLKEVIILINNDYDYENKTYVNSTVMKKISSLTNIPKIIGVASFLEPKPIFGNVLVLDKISDPGNLGTIIRSALAFGIETLIIGDNSVSIYNPKVLRATEGLIFHINIILASLEDIIPKLKKDDYKIYGTDVKGGTSLKQVKFYKKNAIIMGSESQGISNKIRQICDELIYIDMNSKCESLNVAIATSIILYELQNNINHNI